MLAVVALAGAAPAVAADFLEPEQAFQVTAQRVAAAECAGATADAVRFDVRIAPNYYAYREPVKAAVGAPPSPTPLALQLPPGKVKFDENFGKDVETYRERLSFCAPLPAGTPATTVDVVTQGCADAGLCYPPMTTRIALPATAGGKAVAGRTVDGIGAAEGGPGNPATGIGTGSRAPLPSTIAATASATTGGSWLDGSKVGQTLAAGKLLPTLGVFLVLGLLLSLTPCVLPMLPILSSLIVGSGQATTRKRGLLLAASYSLGMALVYTLLGIAAGLAGEGLGAALQTPWALGAFALLMVVLALAMFDFYEIRLPSALATKLSAQSNRLPAGQLAGVFLMGGLSALIVSPCVSAPLAGALLYISQSRDVLLGGSALFSMATGMSVPLLLLGASAGQWVPRAGGWMTTVKRAFGVLMLGVAVYIAQPLLPSVVALALWGAVLVGLGVVLAPWRRAGQGGWSLIGRTVGAVALGFGALQLASAVTGGRDPLTPWTHWVERPAELGRMPEFQVVTTREGYAAALEAARGRPAIVDVSAAWCVSCKEMERFTFADKAVAARMDAAARIKLDVTDSTTEQRALLRDHQLFGPPAILFLDAQGHERREARVIGFQDARRFERSMIDGGL